MKTLVILLLIAVAYDAYVHKSVQKHCSFTGDANYRICMARFDQSFLPWGD